MLTAGKDSVLLPVLSKGMEELVRMGGADRSVVARGRRLARLQSLSSKCRRDSVLAGAQPEARTHRGLRTLDSDGQAGGDQQDPGVVATGGSRQGGRRRGSETVRERKKGNYRN